MHNPTFSNIRRFWLSILILISGSPLSYAQHQRCGFTAYEQALRSQSPVYATYLQQPSTTFAASKRQGTLVIPVVVHVVWNTQAERIRQRQVVSQIDILNADFNRKNADSTQTPPEFQSVAGAADIQFCLAQRGPDGETTSGIVYYETNQTTFSFLDDDVKSTQTGGANAWPSNRYLNIWICNLDNGSVAGYATPPGAPAALDGVVLDYRFTGTGGTALPPGDRGRTGTHEVGHWMDLRHIWGDGGCNVDDGIADTPPQGNSYQGCPSFPQTACGSSNPGAMFMNYMDYTADVCMNLFTKGQVAKMRQVFEPGGARAGFMGALGCFTVSREATPLAALNVYPQGDWLIVEGEIPVISPTLHIQVFSGLGQLIHRDQIDHPQQKLLWQTATSAWSQGVYTVVVEDKVNGIRYQKRFLR